MNSFIYLRIVITETQIVDQNNEHLPQNALTKQLSYVLN